MFEIHHPSLQLQCEEAMEKVAVVRFTEPVLREETLRGTQKELIRLVSEAGRTGLQLDLSDVRFPTASGLGKVVALHKGVRAAGGELSLCNLERLVYEVFDAAGLTDIMDVRPKECCSA